jgi:hypothetical protein
MKNDIYLGAAGSEILLPFLGRKFTEGEIEIAREGRTQSGRRVKDVVAVKKEWSLQFSLIDDSDLQDLITLSELQTELSLKITRMDDSVDTYTVLIKPFDRQRILTVNDGLWGNVKLQIEEV